MIPARKDWGPIGAFLERDAAVPVVSIYVSLLAGVEADPPDSTGITRLAAQMLRMGTRSRSREDLDTAIESLGAEIDISSSHHRVSLSAHVIRENLDPLLDILDEVLNEPGMRPEDFEKLRRETVADIVQARDDDQSVAYRHFRAILFGEHAYGRSGMGRLEHVSRVEWDRVRGHFEGVLRRAGVIVGIAGDFDPGHVEERLTPILGRFSDRSIPPPACADPQPPEAIRIRLVDKPARTQAQIYMGHLAPRADDGTYFPVALLNTAFGGTFTARLSREVRQGRGWSYGAYSRILRAKGRDAFYLWTFPALPSMVPCIGLEMDMLRELRRSGLGREEFDFARSYLDNHFLFAIETASLRVALALRQEVLDMQRDFYERYRERVRAVTFDSIQQAAGSFVDPDNIRIAALCTESEVRKPLEDLFGDGAAIEVVPYDADV